MATAGPRSVRQQKKAINKRGSDEGQTADVTCRCPAGKKTLCESCKKSPKKLKLQKGKTTDDLTDVPDVVTVPSVVTEDRSTRFASRYWNVNFSEYFSKNFKKGIQIKPIGSCCKIRFFNEKIWAPTGNGIKVYNTKGNYLNTVDIKYPRSVEQAFNGDIFVACICVSGLYIMDDSQAQQKVCAANVADLYAQRAKVYALEYEKKMIMEFCCRPGVDDVKQRWRSEKEWRLDEASEYDRLIVTGDEVLQLFVSHWNSHKVCQYNTQGQCIKQFGSRQEIGDGNLYYPVLFGVDRQSHLLVADMYNNVYKILNRGTGQWRTTGVKGESQVCDATLDDEGNLWLSQYNGLESIITKHEQQ